jgi:serine protease Do
MRWLRLAGVVVLLFGVVAGALMFAPGVFGAERATPRVNPRGSREFGLIARWGSALGVSVRDIDRSEAEPGKLPSEGALITDVLRDSPAERAALRSGDVIVEFDGDRVRSAGQLARLVNETPAGRTVKVGVMRAGQRVDVSVTLEGRETFGVDLDRLRGAVDEALQRVWPPFPRDYNRGPEPVPPFTPRFAPPLWAGRGRLGVSVQDLSPQLGEYFGAKQGVLITSVEGGSPAARAGLKAGDVITSVDAHPVTRVQDLTRALTEPGQGAQVNIEIVRDRKTQTIEVTLDDSGRRRSVRYPTTA